MRQRKIVISGTGCALADFVYNGISFNSFGFKKYLSEKAGDGGLSPGKLVLTEELEKFTGMPYQEIIRDIIGNRTYDAFNVGGPSLVSLIHASQLLSSIDYEVRFYGMAGRDETAEKIFEIVSGTPLNIDNYSTTKRKTTPFTHVLSDPNYDNGHGERTFINNIGAAWEYTPGFLYKSFFNSHIVCFGGTALVPQIHDNLTVLLARAKKNNCITLVNTVFDFRNEKHNPAEPWPLGKSDESYGLIDVLIMDREETLKISGQNAIEKAAEFFTSTKISSFIITNGANNIFIWSGGRIFKKTDITQLPVSRRVTDIIKYGALPKGDTTGCGDNFAGGIIASLAWQLKTKSKGQFDLTEAASWGIASGGFTCFIIGGTYLEKASGEKLAKVRELQEDYLNQIKSNNNLDRTSRNKKIIIFGAGKIGRSFIGQLFSRGGYEVVFIDINKLVIDELNCRRSYNVIVKSDKEEMLKIENIRGVHFEDETKVINEISTAGIMAVSVGLRGLDKVFPLIARGLLERYKADHDYPLDIIIAENLRNADILFHSELAKLLPKFYPIDKLVGLIETSIGKMVPIMTQKELEEDSLKVFAEPYNSLIVAKNGFRNPIPDLKYLEPKDNIKAWVDRKLFIHNLGHATVAYLGFQKNCKWVFIHDALSDHEIFMTTRCTMLQSADILMAIYPGEFTRSQLESHIDDLLDRFQNKALGDTIFRVGCDLYRKLSPSDRLVAPIHAAIILNKPYDLILKSLMAAISFCAVDDNGKYYPADEKFFSESEKGISYILEHICKLNTVSLNWE